MTKHQEFFDRFRSLSKQNVKLLWIEGNHDFFIRELAQKHGFDVCDGQLIKNIHGKKVYLAHGDLVDSSDLSYLKWRNFTRNKTIRRIIKCFPSNFAAKKIESIGKKLSEQSRKRKAYWKVKLEEQKKIFQDFAVEKIHHGFHGVFLGHSHIPELHRENTRGFYLNLGSWTGRTASYALWDPINDEVPRVINYSLKGA